MRKEMIETGKNVESAIDAACEKLGCARDECEWEIIDLPKKSFLGLRTTPAKVKVWIEVADRQLPQQARPQQDPPRRQQPAQRKQEPGGVRQQQNSASSHPVKRDSSAPTETAPRQQASPAPRPSPSDKPQAEQPSPANVRPDEKQTAKAEVTMAYIDSMLQAMGLQASLQVSYEEGGACINIEGQGLGVIIGRRGETLDAIQYLASLVANRLEGDYMRITVDCGNYREKRRQTLESLARKLSSQVLKSNVSKTLEPMNPFERRIIHATVSEIEGVSSTSIGEEPNRRVVITSPTAKSRGPRRAPGTRESAPRGEFRGSDRRPPRGAGPRREGDRDRRRPTAGPRQAPPVEQGPPKQTPEANTDKPLYAKIDLE